MPRRRRDDSERLARDISDLHRDPYAKPLLIDWRKVRDSVPDAYGGDDFDWDDEPAQAFVPPERPEDADGVISAREAEHLREVLSEIAQRNREALRLYRPLPLQEAFHRSRALERVIRGGNRGGKTLGAAVEFARAVTGQDPFGKYPSQGRAIVVGKDLTHCSKVFYRKLFKPGPFRIVKDASTGQWRAFVPSEDAAIEHLAVNAPPLIPRRFYSVKDLSWENKREEIPKSIRLKTGWEISFFSSLGEAPQGWDVDLVWFDEEIEHPSWYPEMSARLIDRNGKFLWSATPQAGTIQLYELSVRAAEVKEQPNPPIEEFHVTLHGNEYISEQAKADFIAKIHGEDERRVRVDGDFALLGMKVYPEFDRRYHCMDSFDVPDEWTRIVSIDPGRQVCAVLFAAVPNPSSRWKGKVFLYDELYIKKCSAQKFADAFHAKVVNQTVYYALFDHHAGRQTEIGSGKTIEQQYISALRQKGVTFARSGSCQFEWGSDDIKGGIEMVREGLAVENGEPRKWVVFRDRCPSFLAEVDRYSYKRVTGAGGSISVPSDEPIKLNDHLMDCWRYLASANPRWAPVRSRKGRARSYTEEILRRKRQRARDRSGWGDSVKVG